MKLYIPRCSTCHTRIYLSNLAYTRNGLRRQLRSETFYLRCATCNHTHAYTVTAVRAESSKNSTAAGTMVGGLIGLLAGPLGAMIGAGLGAALGGADDTEENQRVANFNQSW